MRTIDHRFAGVGPAKAHSVRLCRLLLGLLLLVAGSGAALRAADTPSETRHPGYEFRQEHDPDGIGKFYFGREIAAVMGHQGADWLERPEREAEEKPGDVVKALDLKTGDWAADVGAGTGYFSWRLASLVGDRGRVYAVDLQREMLDLLSDRMAERGVTNVLPVQGTITNTGLPDDAIDLVLMVDVYHEFSHPYEMVQSICRSLKPGGRIVFVEYRAEDPDVPIKRVHKMSEAQVRKEMAPHPLKWVTTLGFLPRQHILIFSKVSAPPG